MMRRRMHVWSREIVIAVMLTVAAAAFLFAALAHGEIDHEEIRSQTSAKSGRA
jgi:succinate dehydrogenase hydrophobic anchor subunit